MDYQAQPYRPLGTPCVMPKAKPWMARRPNELPHEHMRRLNHTCYQCGLREEDLRVLDEHEDTHTSKG